MRATHLAHHSRSYLLKQYQVKKQNIKIFITCHIFQSSYFFYLLSYIEILHSSSVSRCAGLCYVSVTPYFLH